MQQDIKVRLLIVSGRSGSGKTSVANEMAQQLRRRGISHAHIDGDNLDMTFPEDEGPSTMLANLKAMWTEYSRRGFSTLILSGTAIALEFSLIKDVIESATQLAHGGTDKSVSVDASAVILTISDKEAHARLSKREVGSELAQLVASSDRMALILPEKVSGDAAYFISTERRDVREIALHVLNRFNWLG